jgi:hypothetical protein
MREGWNCSYPPYSSVIPTHIWRQTKTAFNFFSFSHFSTQMYQQNALLHRPLLMATHTERALTSNELHDSLGGGPQLIIVNHIIIFRRKLNSTIMKVYLDRHGNNLVTEGAENRFPPTWRHRPTRNCTCAMFHRTTRAITNWRKWRGSVR